MPAGPDDLEKLLGEVRKTIRDNHDFLKFLADDAPDMDAVADDADEAPRDGEFEEL
ncbi:MAG: hypothetical protein HYV06_02185 [Deltaproteobacteria bacterium]|nr:hypothetical protein [Deltaproteobacteria bacterium]